MAFSARSIEMFCFRRIEMNCRQRVLAFSTWFALISALLAPRSTAQGQTDPSGDWVLTTVVFGENLGERLQLKAEKDQLSGTLLRDEGVALKGTFKGQGLTFSFKESGGDQSRNARGLPPWPEPTIMASCFIRRSPSMKTPQNFTLDAGRQDEDRSNF
jgi:hypothetical protein